MIDKLLNNRFFVLFIAPFSLGLISVLSFQPFNYTFLNFILLPLIFYLTVYIKKKSKGNYRKKPLKKNLFIFGTSFGFGFYLSGIHWITNSLTFDESFKILIPFGLVLIPLFLSLFFSLLIVFVGSFLNFNLRSILLFSASMAVSDFIKAKLLTGFPWNLWVYSLSWATEILQILNKLGLFAFNLIIITIFMIPAIIFIKLNSKIKFTLVSITAVIIFIFYIYGNHSINQNQETLKDYNEKYRVKIISPNFDLEYNLSEDEILKRFNNLIRYSNPTSGLTTLFVWPEGVFSGYSFDELRFLKKEFEKNFDNEHLILFGVNRLDKKINKFYNSLVIVNNRMEIVNEYNKQKLVPFGEFLPFEKILTKIGLKKITEGHGSFLKGDKQKNLIINNLNILPLICYEVIFTEFIQKSNSNTNIIINISEDGWFGNSIGPKQHFIKGVYRAIEQDTFLIRSANKGISAIISNKGEIVKRLDPGETGNIELQVPLMKNEKKNKNDLIFFALLITYILIFKFIKKYDN